MGKNKINEEPLNGKCSFCGGIIERGTGRSLVQKDGNMLHFCSNKCQKNLLKLKRNPIKVRWTLKYRKFKGKEITEAVPELVEVAKKAEKTKEPKKEPKEEKKEAVKKEPKGEQEDKLSAKPKDAPLSEAQRGKEKVSPAPLPKEKEEKAESAEKPEEKPAAKEEKKK